MSGVVCGVWCVVCILSCLGAVWRQFHGRCASDVAREMPLLCAHDSSAWLAAVLCACSCFTPAAPPTGAHAADPPSTPLPCCASSAHAHPFPRYPPTPPQASDEGDDSDDVSLEAEEAEDEDEQEGSGARQRAGSDMDDDEVDEERGGLMTERLMKEDEPLDEAEFKDFRWGALGGVQGCWGAGRGCWRLGLGCCRACKLGLGR